MFIPYRVLLTSPADMRFRQIPLSSSSNSRLARLVLSGWLIDRSDKKKPLKPPNQYYRIRRTISAETKTIKTKKPPSDPQPDKAKPSQPGKEYKLNRRTFCTSASHIKVTPPHRLAFHSFSAGYSLLHHASTSLCSCAKHHFPRLSLIYHQLRQFVSRQLQTVIFSRTRLCSPNQWFCWLRPFACCGTETLQLASFQEPQHFVGTHLCWHV